MQRSILWGMLCAAVIGCASTSEEPAWLAEARAREAAPQKEREVAVKGAFRARVAAELLAAPRRDGETYLFSLGIGSEAPIDCWVHDEELDLASSLVAFSNSTFGAISEQFGEVELRRIEGVDAGALAGGAFLSVDWLYRIGGDGEARVGQIKHLAVTKNGHTLYCQHNELGYEQTFRRIVEGLVRSIAYAKGLARKPYYEEISVLAVRDMRVGVQHVSLARDEEGDTRIDLRSYTLFPVDAETFQTSDTFGVEFVRRDGTLINQGHVESVNGELATQLRLDPEAKGLWKVHGTFQQKPIEARIDASQPLGSWLGEVLAVRREIARKGVGGEVVMARWMPDADPTRILEERIAILEQVAGDRFRTAFEFAGIEAEVLADRSGSAASGSIDMGHIEMRFERIFAYGKL
jgi:hypothetical protein